MATSGTNRSAGDLGLEGEMERLRPGLTGYCYRMLGSGFEAEDATQETLLRAWRRSDSLADRAALKSWLFSIATNVCLDQIDARKRRARPVDLADPGTAVTEVGAPLPETSWVLPIASGQVADPDADPADQAAQSETLRLAFVAALQHLPARQRVVLVLREVLRWSAKEVADVLETSVASVNSALQRARATLDELDLADAEAPTRGRRSRRSARRCRRRAGSCRSRAARWRIQTPTPPTRPRRARRSVSPSSPRSSTCRRASALSSSCARCCAGARRRWPTCSRPRWRR